MRKIPQEYENPIDNIIYQFVDPVLPLFNQLNFTPNGITTLSLLSGVAALWFLYNKQFVPFAITYLTSYYLDFLDGAYARKYNMVTKGGDYYDHIKDWSVNLLGLYILFIKYNIIKKPLLIITMAIIGTLTLVQAGCQEKMYKKDESEFLEGTKNMCPANTQGELENAMQYTRYFGCGSFVAAQIVLVCLLLSN